MHYRQVLLAVIIVCNGRISLANDPGAATWLPQGNQPGSVAPAVDAFLRPLHGKTRLLSCRYTGSRLTATRRFERDSLMYEENRWRSAVNVQSVEGDRDALDMNVTFTLAQGTEESAGVAVAFDFQNWSSD